MKLTKQLVRDFFSRTNIFILSLIVLSGTIYYFSNPKPQHYYDYTFRVAENILNGKIAFTEKQPSWLNEFVPFEGFYYSVFPFGSVLTMIPFAFFRQVGAIKEMPAAFIAALAAGAICLFLLLIARRYRYGWGKRTLMVLGILFGTWMWTNLTMAGAWHLALGFAMVGELGAIYFTVFKRMPLLAGLFFALGFGNRTEILLTAPIFMFLLSREMPVYKEGISGSDTETEGSESRESTGKKQKKSKTDGENQKNVFRDFLSELRNPKSQTWRRIALFCFFPFVLGVGTLIYNYLRFHSFTDFGYARIPGVLEEPWYRHGIFSIYYIPLNIQEMLYTPWKRLSGFPYMVPTGFGGSIWWSSPFILFVLRFGARDKVLKYAAWTAIALMTLLLWTHGNPGGWQFGYRYAMVLLPWMFVILLENSPEEITFVEWIAYLASIIVNAYATYLFFWTSYVKP